MPLTPDASPELLEISELVSRANRCLEEGDAGGARRLLESIPLAASLPESVVRVVRHNLIGTIKREIEGLLSAGERETASAHLDTALAIPGPGGEDPVMIRHQAEFFHGMGLAFFMESMFQEALQCQRRAIALYPCPTFQNNLVNTLDCLRSPSVLEDYCDTLLPADLAPHLLIACQPKTGSSFLKNALCRITGFRDVFFFHASGQAEQELYLPILLEFATIPTVTQQHCRASEANVQMMQAFGIRPVVLVRDIHDIVVSLHDFYLQGAVRGTFFSPADFAAMTEESRLDLIIDHVVPWHLQFVASWQQVEREQRLPLMWLTYETMMADKPAALRGVLRFWGLEYPPERVEAGVETALADGRRNRLNKGVSGRGLTGLSPGQKDRIRSLARHFPSADFGILGIPR